jgi:hypothetical protein
VAAFGVPVGAMKFEPFTVKVNALPPGVALPGLTLLISGVVGTTGSMLNVAAFWLKPPPGAGFDAVICASPGLATSEAKIVSAIWLVFELTMPVRGEPFQNAVVTPAELLMNPVPETNRVKVWLPAVILDGARLVRTGVALGCTLVELEPHPETSVARNASIPNMVHRKCINRILR